MSVNEQWRLARTPLAGWPHADDFRWCEEAIPDPAPGQALTRTLYLSLDPYQWYRRRSGVEAPGDVCHGRTVSQVIASQHPQYAEGDYLFNTNGWQSHGLTGEGVSEFNYMHARKLDPAVAPLSTALGIMGMLGLTAYSGLVVQCHPRPGETVVVSAASGGVGQVAGQLARLAGARVVGIAGAETKCRFAIDELGFDACVSHLSASLADDLAQACPDGCDVYFENVGGKVFEAVLPILNRGARITVCGLISQYGNTDGQDMKAAWRARGEPTFRARQVTVHDLFVGNFVDEYQERFLSEMAGHLQAGELQYREDFWSGLAVAPDAFMAMLKGGNFGKTIVTVAEA